MVVVFFMFFLSVHGAILSSEDEQDCVNRVSSYFKEVTLRKVELESKKSPKKTCFVCRAWARDVGDNGLDEWQQEIINILEFAGVEVIYDLKHLNAGGDIRAFIDSVARSNYVIALFSRAFKAKCADVVTAHKGPICWVYEEAKKIEERGKRDCDFFLPLIVEGEVGDSIPDFLQTLARNNNVSKVNGGNAECFKSMIKIFKKIFGDKIDCIERDFDQNARNKKPLRNMGSDWPDVFRGFRGNFAGKLPGPIEESGSITIDWVINTGKTAEQDYPGRCHKVAPIINNWRWTNGLTDADLQIIASNPSLYIPANTTSWRLTGNSSITDASIIASIVRQLPRLQYLELEGTRVEVKGKDPTTGKIVKSLTFHTKGGTEVAGNVAPLFGCYFVDKTLPEIKRLVNTQQHKKCFISNVGIDNTLVDLGTWINRVTLLMEHAGVTVIRDQKDVSKDDYVIALFTPGYKKTYVDSSSQGTLLRGHRDNGTYIPVLLSGTVDTAIPNSLNPVEILYIEIARNKIPNLMECFNGVLRILKEKLFPNITEMDALVEAFRGNKNSEHIAKDSGYADEYFRGIVAATPDSIFHTSNGQYCTTSSRASLEKYYQGSKKDKDMQYLRIDAKTTELEALRIIDWVSNDNGTGAKAGLQGIEVHCTVTHLIIDRIKQAIAFRTGFKALQYILGSRVH